MSKENTTKATPSINVFEHKGFVGIEGTNVQPKGFGCIEDINKDNFKISQKAYDALVDIKKSGGSLGEVDCFTAEDTKTYFGWMGGPLKAFRAGDKDLEVARDTDFTLIKDFIQEVQAPVDFIAMVDEGIEEEEEAS